MTEGFGRYEYAWCTLVFRMLCWLTLHQIDPEDVQGGNMPSAEDHYEEVYIIQSE
jgi:hypothetical protein